MRCPTCGGSDITVVGFETAERAIYRHCRFCESGWWTSRGEDVAITSILEAAKSIEPARRRSA